MWAFGPFRLDSVNQCIWREGTRLSLKPKPYAVLQYLVTHAGRLVTPDELLGAIWPDTFVQAEVLRQYILEIRRILGDRAEAPAFIQTFPKRGWEFIAPVTDESTQSLGTRDPSVTRIVGRAPALAELDGYLSRALDSRRQVVFVVGEAGIGKTSLMDVFQRTASGVPALRVARGQSVEGFGGKEPYYPVLEALGKLARGPAGAHVVNTLQTHAPTWMVQFPALVRRDQKAALQREILGATRERMVREFCEALEVMTAASAIVLILEDLHWADHSTLDVISAIARRREPARLLVIGTFRPADVIVSNGPLKTLKQDLVVHRLAGELPLEGLREADVADYMATAFPASDLPAELPAVIQRHSDGNPLFMTAMLDHLIQQHVLAEASGRWRLTVSVRAVDPGAPETLKQMLEMQLHHVTDSERRLLECASVAGQHFTAWSVAMMLSRDVLEVEAQCAELAERQQFLKVRGPRALSDGTYTQDFAFGHALYREVLYRKLHHSERVRFHRRLADSLERLRSPVVPELAAELALHSEEGGDYERAVRYLMLAAHNATLRYAHREAIEVLEHARGLTHRVAPERAQELEVQILERIGGAYVELGDMARSVETYDGLATRAAEAGLPVVQANALMSIAHPAALVDPDRCIAACNHAVLIGGASNDSVVHARATLLAAGLSILIDGWRTEDAQSHGTAIANLRRLGSDLRPYEQIICSRVQLLQSGYAEAYENAERVLLISEAHGRWERAPALSAKAAALMYQGRLTEAHRTYATGLELAKKNHNAAWFGIFCSHLAWLRSQAYDCEGIRELSSAIRSDATESVLQTRIQLSLAEGVAELAAGRPEQAIQVFQSVRDHPTQPKSVLSWYWRAFARLGLSEAWLATGHLVNAAYEAQTLVRSVATWKESFIRAVAWDVSARIALAATDQPAAEEYVRRGLDVLDGVEVPLAAWQLHATACDVYRETNHEEAEGYRSKAKAIICQIATSLEEIESLQRSFLANPRVRRVLENTPMLPLKAPTGRRLTQVH